MIRGSFERRVLYVHCHNKSSRAKKLPNNAKPVTCVYHFFLCVTAKQCEILYSAVTNMTGIIRKHAKNYMLYPSGMMSRTLLVCL